MKHLILITLCIITVRFSSQACDKCKTYAESPDFKLKKASVSYNKKLQQLEFEMEVAGKAGQTKPSPAGGLNMAPVLGYVFPTTLKPEDVGFSASDGIVALALTTHPDFDDSPLWDENNNRNYNDDGNTWHSHWVILVKDERVKGGFSVKEFQKGKDNVTLPPTAPDMPMYMDSPGFQVTCQGSFIRVAVPAYRVNNHVQFNFDAVACFMKVSAPEGGHGSIEEKKPMLGVYEVYSVLSGNLSLPYKVNE